MFATNLTFQSGWHTGPVVTRISEPDPRFGPPTVTLSNGRVVSNPLATTFRFAGETRSDGQVRAPTKTAWNVRVAWRFGYGPLEIEPGLDVFNILNGGNSQLVGSPNFAQPDGIQVPRSAQVTLRVLF